MLQLVEVLEEQKPGGLLGVIQLTGTAGVLVEDVVDVLEGLLKHLNGMSWVAMAALSRRCA